MPVEGTSSALRTPGCEEIKKQGTEDQDLADAGISPRPGDVGPKLPAGQSAVRHVIYAVLRLTVIRMLLVAAALAGTRLSRARVILIGRFGPRGLASIVMVWFTSSTK